MENLLNPNIAYFSLVLGILLAITALFVPGTGLIELAAVFILLFAGWEVYGLINQLNLWALAILLLGIFLFFLAVRRSGRMIFLLGSILTFIIGSVFLFHGEEWYQPAVDPLLAIAGSTISAIFLWLGTRKYLEAAKAPPAHLQSYIGDIGEVTSPINENQEGTVQLESELWSARSSKSIPTGSEVRVTGREGFTLIVEPLAKSDQNPSES